jgi:D-3-phosphoglycerate dehydrogenase
MRIVIPDDYQDAVRGLDSFAKLRDHEVVIYRDTVKDLDTLAARFAEAEALVLIRERTAISADLLDRLPRLRLISQTGRGTPHMDLEACTARGVAVAAGGGSPPAPAERTGAVVLAALRHLPREIAAFQAGQWQTTLGTGLRGRTLGIFGYGRIGSLVAGYGRAFEMPVLVWGREGSAARAAAAGFAVAPSQEALFEQADVLSLHLKLTEDTRGIVQASDLARMKPSALLVNTSRAELIAPGALEAALRAGRPGFAAVDVYESEPALDHPLLALHNVLCTPHLGYVERDSYELYFGSAFDGVLAFAAGQPINLLNPQVLEKQRLQSGLLAPVNRSALLAFAKTQEGKTLFTRSQKKPFTVAVIGQGLQFTPEETGRPRPELPQVIDRVLAHYNATGSQYTSDYQDITQNSSYLMTLLALYKGVT